MESRDLTPQQRRHRTAAVAALAIGGVTLFGVVAGTLGGDDSPSQSIADKKPDTEAILAREKRETAAKEKRREELIERRAAKRRKKANREWEKLKDNYDAMKGQSGTDPGSDQPASTPSSPAPSTPAQQPQAPATTPATPPQATQQSAPTPQPAAPSGGGDPRFYGIP